jgi:DHA2 family multidrug resistance protein
VDRHGIQRGMMFIGPFSVYLGGLLGARRVLLACAGIFTLVSITLPFAPNLPVLLTLLVLAGLTGGTFYPLTLSFVLRNLPMRYVLLGIAMYAMDILVTTTFATSLEAWFTDHLSWRWIFWNGAALTPVMMILVYFGMPWQPLPQPKEGQPKPNWRGFLYASLGFSLLFIALDQGQRLDWLNSGTIVGLIASGGFLLLATAVRRLRMPNPLINFTVSGAPQHSVTWSDPDLLSLRDAGHRRGNSQLSWFRQRLPSICKPGRCCSKSRWRKPCAG